MKTESSTLPEIAFLFFRQGCLGFGGPVAAMALLESEFQREKGWITPEHYAEMFSVTKILPGPVATQQAIFLGRYRRGFLGGLTAGVFYILPAFLLVMGLSALYLRGGGIAGMDALFGGFQIGVLAIIFLSVWNMSRPYRSGFRNWLLIGVATLVIGRYPRLEPFFIIGAGLFGVFRVWFTNRKVVKLGSFLVFPLAGLFSSPNASANGSATAAAAVTASASVSSSLLSKVFWVCFKA